MKITTVGLDLAKSVFHVVCFDAQHREIRKRMLRRGQVREFFSQMEPCVVAMEACAGAHYWGREIEKLGHKAKLIPPQFVKPYLQGNKNDYNDARAIAEASTRPKMRFVELKTVEQQDVQALHRLREQRVKERTALCNQLRALVAEYGLVMNKGVAAVRRGIPELLEDAENGLSEAFRALLKRGYDQLVELEKHIDYYTWADVGSPTFHVGERCLVPWWQGWASCVSPTYRNQRPALANENRTQDAVRHD